MQGLSPFTTIVLSEADVPEQQGRNRDNSGDEDYVSHVSL